jgi:hypothetical protein
MCVCWFSAKHTCLIKAIGDSQDIVSTCWLICNRTEFVLYFILFYWASWADVGYQVYSLCLTSDADKRVDTLIVNTKISYVVCTTCLLTTFIRYGHGQVYMSLIYMLASILSILY